MSAEHIARCIICETGQDYQRLRDAVQLFTVFAGERLLLLCEKVDQLEGCIPGVAEFEFEDNVVNWGRIVALLSFGKLLTHYFPTEKEKIANDVATFVTLRLNHWIVRNGGWSNFE